MTRAGPLWGLLAAGDPGGHVAAAYRAEESVREHYTLGDIGIATEYRTVLVEGLRQPGWHLELHRLGRSLNTWAEPILAWHTTGVSSRPAKGRTT